MTRVKVRTFKPGKYGKGTIPDEAKPEAQVWRVGKWDGKPHHDDVSEALGIERPMVTFHIDRQSRFFFHHSGDGHLKPKDPARLAAAVEKQHPALKWGRESVEQHETTTKTLAMNGRPLRDFEKGAHLHVLDWTHDTARHRFQAAGAIQVKAASKAVVNGKVDAPPSLPSLEAALHGELRKLDAVGHATVRSELDHQQSGEALPVGLSKAPSPPNLRTATSKKKRCGTCKMFDNGSCWGYGNYGVEPDETCDSWAAETVKTLAVGDPPRDQGSLRFRASLIASDVAHRIFQAVHRARLQGITDKRRLRQLGREAGHTGLRVAASSHAGGAISAGRQAAANGHGKVVGARYTSVLDKSTCGPCGEADTGQLLPLDQVPPAPNPACLGGDRCRCILVYQLSTEQTRTPTPPRPSVPAQPFPDERDQPDRASGSAALRVAQVGVGAS